MYSPELGFTPRNTAPSHKHVNLVVAPVAGLLFTSINSPNITPGSLPRFPLQLSCGVTPS